MHTRKISDASTTMLSLQRLQHSRRISLRQRISIRQRISLRLTISLRQRISLRHYSKFNRAKGNTAQVGTVLGTEQPLKQVSSAHADH